MAYKDGGKKKKPNKKAKPRWPKQQVLQMLITGKEVKKTTPQKDQELHRILDVMDKITRMVGESDTVHTITSQQRPRCPDIFWDC